MRTTPEGAATKVPEALTVITSYSIHYTKLYDDEVNDSEIRQLLFKLKGKQTLVIISHRFSTIADCDVIINLDAHKQ